MHAVAPIRRTPVDRCSNSRPPNCLPRRAIPRDTADWIYEAGSSCLTTSPLAASRSRNLLPKGVIAFPGSGITDNLVDKARTLGIPVQRIAA